MDKVININKKLNKPKPHSRRKAQQIINELALKSENISYTAHCKEQMLKRGFLYNDLIRMLQEGIITKDPAYSEEKRSWKYKLDFLGFEGNRDAACVASIHKKGKLTAITVMWIDL